MPKHYDKFLVRWDAIRNSQLNRRIFTLADRASTVLIPAFGGAVALWGTLSAWRAYKTFITQFGELPSGEIDKWGQYGDFFGGVVGTYATIVSVALLGLTFYFQNLQLKHARQQSVRDELQRLIASTSKVLDELLDSPMDRSSSLLTSSVYVKLFHEKIDSSLSDGLTIFHHHLVAGRITQSNCALAANEPQAVSLVRSLSRMEWCLGQFASHDGSPVIAAFYGSQYSTATLFCYVLYRPHFSKSAVTNMGLAESLPKWDKLIAAIDAKEQ